MNKILYLNDRTTSEERLMVVELAGTHITNNILSVASEMFDLVHIGYQNLNAEFIKKHGFVGTIRSHCSIDINFQLPRPVIGIPDNEFDMINLGEYDAVIAHHPFIQKHTDESLFACPIDFKPFEAVENGDSGQSKTLISNREITRIQPIEIARIFDNTGLQFQTYYNDKSQMFYYDNNRMGNITLFERMGLQDYRSLVWSSFGGCNINTRPLGVGKVAAISAYAKRISIGYPHTCQEILYPDLTSWDWRELRKMLFLLQADDEYYRECVERAHNSLDKFDLDKLRPMIKNYINDIYGGC